MKIYYVYELINPLNNQLFYIGKGTKAKNGYPYTRLKEHIKDSLNYRKGLIPKTHKYLTILKILDSGCEPIMNILHETNIQQESLQKEIDLISYYGRRDLGNGILCNHTDGGEGSSGWNHKRSHIENMKVSNPGGDSVAKKIVSIDPNSLQKTVYSSSRQAALRVTGNPERKSNIHHAANRAKNRTCYGYYWRMEIDYDPTENFYKLNEYRKDKSKRSSKPILQINEKGQTIKEWPSASEICRFYGVSVSALHPKIKSESIWKGYFWKKK